MFESVLRWWCRAVHNNVLHPVHGKYICGVCLREWPVPWAEPERAYSSLKPAMQTGENSDVLVTAPQRGTLLIRLPIRSFSSADTSPEGLLAQKAAGAR